MKKILIASLVLSCSAVSFAQKVDLGPRPQFLINQMQESALKTKLLSCSDHTSKVSDFSIGHRGAPLQFPEHTKESYQAAALMGAGIIECDVTFTKDLELVCRHAQNDLHTTTNILATPLANNCTAPFNAATADSDASAECRASDITLSQFQSLTGKMDAANNKATSVEQYLDGTANWRTDLYSTNGTLMTHAQSIELIKSLGGKFTPELKTPSVEMPFNVFTQEDYAQKMVDEYKAAGVPASDVFVQSFNLDDVLYWINNEPAFGKQAVYLDDSYNIDGFDYNDPKTFAHSMKELKDLGVNYIAPPMYFLVTLKNGKMVPSNYAIEAKKAGLNLITWTLERSGPLNQGGGWYYQSVTEAITDDGKMYELLDVLYKDVGIKGIFSDWPATVTYYANCMGIE